MRTARPVTPRPPTSPLPSCHRVSGFGTPALGLAPHGAAPLAPERLLLLPVPVPGGARAAREGAAGQVRTVPYPGGPRNRGLEVNMYRHVLHVMLHLNSLPEAKHGGNNPYSSFGATLDRDDEKNLWSMPHDVSHTEADDDRILYNLIVIRNQQTKDSEEWQRLNYDIYSLRQIRREVRNRWRRILEDLGFQREADSLLSVTKLSTMSDSKNTRKAQEMLLKLAEETSIFPASWELSERYLLVVSEIQDYGTLQLTLSFPLQLNPRRSEWIYGGSQADRKLFFTTTVFGHYYANNISFPPFPKSLVIKRKQDNKYKGLNSKYIT
ncbi:hypothetical protein STEG23_014248, partial [Scotinomys teguina]